MALQAPRGTIDILPNEAHVFSHITKVAKNIFSVFGYQLIETPAFELTEVFVRGIGKATDVVGKEMFHVMSQHAATKLRNSESLKADEQLTLRPEGTAGLARAVVQHNLAFPGSAPSKLWYTGTMFRHERPQKGRLRQFHQIGLECLGAAEPSIDAEIIIALMRFFAACNIPAEAMQLYLNSMGDDNCRPAYRAEVSEFIAEHSSELCEECNRRASTNPLRAFDCKNPDCSKVMNQAPKISDFLCDDCQRHYHDVKSFLSASNISYQENPRLVRGLDYYTRTVFEVQVDVGLGSQNAIGGGGRYDKLIEEFGGKPTPGLGFAVGLERIALVLEALNIELPALPKPMVFVAAAGSEAEIRKKVFDCAQTFREFGIATELDHQARSLKSQLKLADKLGAQYSIVIGIDELTLGVARLRNLTSHDEREIALNDLHATAKELQEIYSITSVI